MNRRSCVSHAVQASETGFGDEVLPAPGVDRLRAIAHDSCTKHLFATELLVTPYVAIVRSDAFVLARKAGYDDWVLWAAAIDPKAIPSTNPMRGTMAR